LRALPLKDKAYKRYEKSVFPALHGRTLCFIIKGATAFY